MMVSAYMVKDVGPKKIPDLIIDGVNSKNSKKFRVALMKSDMSIHNGRCRKI